MSSPAKILVAALAAVGTGLLAGCPRTTEETYVRWTPSRRTRMLAFRNIETLGVAQVIDETGKKGLDAEAFGRALASELSALKRFRVVYPKKVAEDLARQKVVRVSAASEVELLEAARAARMDALLVVRVQDFKPYYPPRIGFKARLYATEIHGGLSARDILEWSDDGVPQDVSPALNDRFIWARDELADALDRNVAERVRLYAMGQDRSKHPMGPEVFLRSMDRFFQFLAHGLSAELYRDSLAFRGIQRHIERERVRRGSEADGYPVIAP